MPIGDLTLFEEYSATISNLHDLDADTIFCALITTAVTPTAADTTPALADYTEVTPGGNYAANGIDIAASFTEAAGTATFDGVTNPQWLQNAGNPTNARWGIVHDTTAGAIGALCFIDLGSIIDMTTGDLTVTWHASGIHTLA